MVSTTAEYGLRAAVFLAQNQGRSWTSQEIAEATKVPPLYLSKVLQHLVRAGLVSSRRGVGGGFLLNREPGKISVLDLLDATDNPLKPIDACPLGISDHVRLCTLHRLIDDVVRGNRLRFEKTTLADMCVPTRGVRPLCSNKAAIKLDPGKRQ
jgi:Rrf2 family protein